MASLPAPVRDMHGLRLPSRYTIRPLNNYLAPWAKALMIHGFFLQPSIWQPLLPKPKTANALRAFNALDGHFSHAINSGHSYAIVDSEYVYRRPGGSGGLYWDELDPNDADFERYGRTRMLEGMDFPLVCVALSVDGFDRKSDEASAALYDFMPLVRELGSYFAGRGQESEYTWQPDDLGQLLIRSGCVTKDGYESQGLMTVLNHFVMLEARAKGYQAISAGVASQSVYRNWMRPPPGCCSRVVADVDIGDIELEDEDGRLVRPYVGSDTSQRAWLIWCELNL